MPTKPNKAGQQQPYVPAGNGDASGEYSNSEGVNIHFTSFKQPEVKNTVKKEKVVEEKKETKPSAKSLNDYTDELFSKLNLKTFTSKKYKNAEGDIVEIRRFGEGKNAIRYNETKKIVEQMWHNGAKIN